MRGLSHFSSYSLLGIASSKHLAVKLGLELHGHELLKKQLASVWDLNLTDVFARVARLAMVFELVEVRLAEQPTLLAHVHPVAV